MHLERNPQVGMLLLELAEKNGNGDRGRARGGTDRELTRQGARALGRDLVEHLLLELEQSLCTAEQPQSRLRWLDAAPRAVEQLRPEPLLERSHLKRHGWLRDAESLCRLREAPQLDNGTECGELPGIHKQSLSQESAKGPKRWAISHSTGARRTDVFKSLLLNV